MSKYKIIGLFLVWLLNLSSQTNWQDLGVTNASYQQVNTMYKDTATNILYVGGIFPNLGGNVSNSIAQWNGYKWDTLKGGILYNTGLGDVRKIIKYKGLLYFFGQFNQVGNIPCRNMARWNGSQWDTLIGGVDDGIILDADVYNDTLYVCGDFTGIGNIQSNYAAKFDGTTWHSMTFPFTTDGAIYHIRAFKNKVYGIGTWYANGFGLTAEYTQQNGWQPSLGIQGDMNKGVFGIERIDTLLYFFGRFTHLSSLNSPDIAAWSGTNLYGFGGGIEPSSNFSCIYKIKKIKNRIYCVGTFDNANGLTNGSNILNIASFTTNDWCIYGDDISNTLQEINEYNDTIVVAGGPHTINGQGNTRLISKWIGGAYTFSCNNYYAGIKNIDPITNSIQIFPNPTTTTINIVDESNELQNSTIQIKNYLGQVVLSTPFKTQIEISNLTAGIYFLTIEDKYNKKTIKIIKQ